MNYIHYNPVKHGYAKRPLDWEYGSFKKWVQRSIYEETWGANYPQDIANLDYEWDKKADTLRLVRPTSWSSKVTTFDGKADFDYVKAGTREWFNKRKMRLPYT